MIHTQRLVHQYQYSLLRSFDAVISCIKNSEEPLNYEEIRFQLTSILNQATHLIEDLSITYCIDRHVFDRKLENLNLILSTLKTFSCDYDEVLLALIEFRDWVNRLFHFIESQPTT